MDSSQPDDAALLAHKFRIEDNTVEVLIDKLQTANVPPDRVGMIARKVLDIAGEALSRSELSGLIEQAAQQFPELEIVSVQEELYIKEEAERIIKATVEDLIQKGQVEDALSLAKAINQGEVPADLQERLKNI